MNRQSKFKKDLNLMCEELGPEDGANPKKFFSRKTSNSNDRKTYQLCKETRLILNLTLSGELKDPMLRDLSVCSVEPLPEGGDLLVVLSWSGKFDDFDGNKILSSIKLASGYLRSEVARSINRKKVPEFSFRILHPGEVRQ